MEVKILKNLTTDDLEAQISSYHSTGWRMDGNVVVAYLGQENIDGYMVDRVLYAKKMARD